MSTPPRSPEAPAPGRPAGYPYLVPVILLWAMNPLLVPGLSAGLPVPQINLLATCGAVLVLAAATVASGRWRELRSWRAREYGGALLLGAIGIFPYSSLYFLAFSLAPEAAGATNIINYLWPIWTVLISAFILRERLTWRKILGLLLSFAGVAVIISGGRFVFVDGRSLPAYLCAACGAFFWGLFSALGKRRRADPLCSMLLYSIGAGVCFGALALAVGGMRAPTAAQWGAIATIGVGSNGLAYLLWLLALRHGDTARVGSLVYLVPFVALLYLRIFRGSPITAVHLVALLLVVAGPLVQSVRIRPRDAPGGGPGRES